MPLKKMPNGEYVRVPDNIAPEALARIENQYRRQARRERREPQRPAVQRDANARPDEEQEITNRAARLAAAGGGKGFADSVNNGYLFGAQPMLSGAVNSLMEGVPNAIREGDFSEIGRAYRVGKGTEDRLATQYSNDSGGASMAGEIIGAVANPMGTGAGGVRAIGRALPNGGRLQRAANALAGQMGVGPVRSAISAGATQGAINSATRSDSWSEVPGNLARGAATGAVAGGVIGGGSRALGAGAEIISDALPRNAARTARIRIKELLDKSGISPARAEREIAVTDARGGDAALMDLSPRLRAKAGRLSRNTNLNRSDELVTRGDDRIADRNARFGENVSERATTPGTSAHARSESIEGGRRAQGDIDYAPGGPMDAPLAWSDDLERFFKESPDADALIKDAYIIAQRYGQNLGQTQPGPNGTIQAIPSMRVMDYLKRAYDKRIGPAIRSGDTVTASSLSANLKELRRMLGEANPEYAPMLAAQRDAFEKVRAIEFGEGAMAKVAKDPRALLRELQAMTPEMQLEARIGIIDAIMAKNIKADPVAFIRSVTRTPEQRAVFEMAFGGKKEFASFQRWIRREHRAAKADRLTASDQGSETSRMHLADDEGGVGVGLAHAAGRGAAFGPFIAVSNVWQKITEMARMDSTKVQDEIAALLMGKAKGLPGEMKEVAEYTARREANAKRIATALGKGGQQPFTGVVGGGSIE